MRLWQHGGEVFGTDQVHAQSGYLAWVTNQSEVQVAVEQLLDLLAAGERTQRKLNPGPLLAEPPDGLGDGGVTGRTHKAQPDPTAHAGSHAGNVVGSFIEFIDGSVDAMPERHTGGGQRHPARGAVKQLNAKFPLQPPDGDRQGRLREVETFSRTAEVEFLGNYKEVPELS